MRLTRQQELFRDSVRRVLDHEIAPHIDEWERSRVMPVREVYAKLGELGYLGLTHPVQYGGLGLDLGYSYVWAQELGRLQAGSIPMSLSVQTDIATPLLAEYGSQEVKQSLLTGAISGQLIAAIAVTEPAGGSDVGAIETYAERTADGYVISGQKAWITNGSVADFVVTLCRTSSGNGIAGLSLIVVPTDLPGVTQQRIIDKLGNWSCDHGHLTFDRVVVPAENLLGVEGRGYELQTRSFARERCFLAVVACSQSDRMLRRVVDYVARRRILGTSLLSRQAVSFQLAELVSELDLVASYAGSAYEKLTRGEDCTRESAIAKLRAARLVRSIADWSLQFHGAVGYMTTGGVERDLRDARAASLAGGADEALLHFISGFLTHNGVED